MSACRVAVMAAVALASAPAEAGETRVAFVVLAGPEADSRGAVDAARAECAEQGLSPLPVGALRAALEEPQAARRDDLIRAHRLLQAGREAYTRFEYAGALTELNAVETLLVHREPTGPVLDLMVERNLLAGLVHEGQGRTAEARRAFRLLRQLDPRRRQLDAGAYRPQVVELFAEAAPDQDLRASLRVAARPDGAVVYVDGRRVGRAPLLRRVSAGRHWVVAAAPGHRARGAMVDVDGARRELSLPLAAQSPVDRAADLRRSLLEASGPAERRAFAAELARAADVQVLVLVRARAGQAEGAVFDARRGLLSGWLAMPSEPLRRRIAAAAAPDLMARGQVAADGSLAAAPPPGDDAGPSWYSTWWGRTLIVAGGVAVGGAVFFAVSGGDDTYTLGEFCFAGSDCR